MRLNIAIALLTVALLLFGVLFGGVTMAIGMLVHEASVLLVIAIAMMLLRPTLNLEGESAGQTPRREGEAQAPYLRKPRAGDNV